MQIGLKQVPALDICLGSRQIQTQVLIHKTGKCETWVCPRHSQTMTMEQSHDPRVLEMWLVPRRAAYKRKRTMRLLPLWLSDQVSGEHTPPLPTGHHWRLSSQQLPLARSSVWEKLLVMGPLSARLLWSSPDSGNLISRKTSSAGGQTQ